MKLLSFLGELISPVTQLIDNMHTSEEEKLNARNQLVAMQNALTAKLLDYETRLLDAQSAVINTEAQGESWMQRNWRPITMLTFLFLVVMDTFGFTEYRLAAESWTLLQLGLGGYVIGRSVEKVAPQVVTAMKEKGS